MKQVDLTKGKVISVITMLALPIMGSSLLQFTYNIIDMMWVGRLGSNAVASIGSSSLYVNIGNAISSLAIIGCGIKVAHSIGQKDDQKVKEYINAGIMLNAIIALVFGLVLIFAGKGFIGFLNLNNSEVEKDAYSYLAVNAPILFFAFFNMMFTRIMNSFGNNKLAFKINAVGVVLNIFLDPLCIYNLKLGVVGAAVSTLIANIIMFIIFIISTDGILKYKAEIGVDFAKVKEIAKLGFPMAFQRLLFTFINIMLAKIIAVFGSDAIAAQKIGVQIESVAFMIVGGFNGAVAGFTGQNYGAKKYERIKEGYKSALVVGVSYALIMASLFLMFNKPMIRVFIRDEATIDIAASYLKVVAFSQMFSAVEMISNGLFTGIGKPKIPASISIVFTILRIPCALVLIKPFGINGVWISICITSVLKGICAYIVYVFKIKRNFLKTVDIGA
ncbi:MAG: MATE family efflux transporter [Inconstantimicrobium porci]|uniref:MATE family efflux transporter n=1 Tax=Inconstantimicrobium porci TaxID=2652291 RepID=UPI002409FCA2|nr:MATE family efflux transporter [Inconstantimicrobium porci]MDD6770873.1 MATE family efflux transporter [Inconstantimicrobium porci]MDY5912410.1 MATE family efflux transporter [Inconstantimicrobium porci]